MSCHTCDHTMSKIDTKTFWCPRCGSIKNGDVWESPKLPGRVAEFASHFTELDDNLIERFERLGLRESICID